MVTWYNEMNTYNFSNPGYNIKTHHFTQLVWDSSNEIGVGFAVYHGILFNYYYCVSHYFPKGNIQGEYEKNVKRLKY